MKLSISAHARVDFGGAGAGAEVVAGFASQDRLDLATLPATFPTEAQLTVDENTRYLSFSPDSGRYRFYAGPSQPTAAVKQARALVVEGQYTVYVQQGDVVHVWAAP